MDITLAKEFFQQNKPAMAMLLVQFIFTFGTLAAKALFSSGSSLTVFITYRQAVATLVMIPTALLLRGCTLNQYLYYQGLNLTSSSMGSAMNNLIPAVTFIMATTLGQEKLELRSVRSMAKVLGTIICVVGVVFMAIYKGPKLLNTSFRFHSLSSIVHLFGDQWMIGFIFLTGATCCGSLWRILQVPICKNYLDPLSLATWMCILSTFQSATLTYSIESDKEAWKITSTFELLFIIYMGIFASGVTFYLQSWVISVRGAVFSALFNPAQIVMTTILGFLLLDEELHIGSLIGAIAVVSGLYTVLWGKGKELEANAELKSEDDSTDTANSVVQQSKLEKDDISKPLLSEGQDDIESQVKTLFN